MKKYANYLLPFAFILAPFLVGAQDTAQVDKKAARAAKQAEKDAYWTNFRNYDQSGINVFEPKKEATAPFDKVKVRFGAGFTQNFQDLNHENARSKGTSTTTPELYPRLAPGFNVAQANLYMDAMLAEGIQLNLTTYLSSRHHNETWVKGGYIQIDKLPFQGEFWDNLMKKVRIKAGHFEINYGDQHYRRSDGGHALYNPFVENYIMDQFATEVAGEVYYMSGPITLMGAVSNGLINGGHQEPLVPGSTTQTYKRGPSFYGKLAWDKELSDNMRLRLSGSGYVNNNDGRSTLFAGDRTGSNYYFVLDPANATSTANYTSGRLSGLNFSQQVATMQFNAFFQVGGLELFGTYETANGRTIAEKTANFDKRSVNQTAFDAIYRFGASKNVFIGARYNAVSGQMIQSNANEQSINRFAVAGGWFVTKNVLAKLEYVTQEYNDFPTSDIRNGGKFNGYVFQAIVGF